MELKIKFFPHLRQTLLLLAAASLVVSLSNCQRHKLAYVNPVKLRQEYEGVKAKLAQLQIVLWQSNVDTLNAELQRASAFYQHQRESFTAAQHYQSNLTHPLQAVSYALCSS